MGVFVFSCGEGGGGYPLLLVVLQERTPGMSPYQGTHLETTPFGCCAKMGGNSKEAGRCPCAFPVNIQEIPCFLEHLHKQLHN